MRTIVHILYYKIKSFFKLTAEVTPRNVVKNLGSGLVFGAFAFGAFLFTRATVSYLMDTMHIGLFLLHRFLSMALYVFFFSVNIGNIIVSYATLYRSKETAYLLTTPVPHTALFVIRFLDTFFYSSTTLFLMAVAVLLGYGTYFHFPWTFYLQTMLFEFIPFLLIAASIGVIALMLLIQIASKIGAKAIFVIIAAGYLSVIFLYFKMTNPVALVNNVFKYYPYIDQHFGFLDPPFSVFLPNYWIAEALYWTAKGNASLANVNILRVVGASACMMTVMILYAKNFYYSTWLTSLELRAQSEVNATSKGLMSFSRDSKLERQMSALLKKEFWQFFREPSQWIHLLIMAILVIVFVTSIAHLNLRYPKSFLQTVSYLVLYIFNAFLVSSIALRFVYPMIGIEGNSYWAIRSAPITVRKFYWLKFLFAVLPIAIISFFLSVISHRQLRWYPLLTYVGIGTAPLITLALVSLNLGMGSFFSDFKEANPIRVASSQGATITFLLSIVYLVFIAAVLFLPLQSYFEAITQGNIYEAGTMSTALWTLVTGSAFVAFISSFIGIRALGRDF